MTRAEYQAELTEIIHLAMSDNFDMIREAITEGRIGLNEMSDEDLVEFGKDCWGMKGEIS